MHCFNIDYSVVTKSSNKNENLAVPLFAEYFRQERRNFSTRICGKRAINSRLSFQYPHIARFCKHSPLTAEVLHTASMSAINFCHEYFRNKRWNCRFEKQFLFSGKQSHSYVETVLDDRCFYAIVEFFFFLQVRNMLD